MEKPLAEMTLNELTHHAAVVQDYRVKAIVRARRAGQSWTSIAGQLGVSQSEAHRRYSWLDKLPQTESEA